MTRINLVPVEELIDKHLIAEYRELPRIFKLARECYPFPKKYCLGTGHMRFFYNKLLFLYKRQVLITNEMQRRGFTTNYKPETLKELNTDKVLWNDWVPTTEEIQINKDRLEQRKREILGEQYG